MQLKIIQGKNPKELEEAVNDYLQDKANSDFLWEPRVLISPRMGHTLLATIWLRSTWKREEGS